MIVTRFINRFLEIFWFGQIDPFGNVKLFHRYMKIILMIFPKKNACLWQMDHFGPQNGPSSYLWICSKSFFEIFAQ